VGRVAFSLHLGHLSNFCIIRPLCVTTDQPEFPDTKSNPNPNAIPNPTTKQHAIVSIHLHLVACPTSRDEITRGGVVAPFLQISVFIATLLLRYVGLHCVRKHGTRKT